MGKGKPAPSSSLVLCGVALDEAGASVSSSRHRLPHPPATKPWKSFGLVSAFCVQGPHNFWNLLAIGL